MNWIIALPCILLVACVSAPATDTPIPVDFWRVGDDGLTQRFAEALQQRLRASGRYRLITAGEHAEIVITITDHARPVTFGGVDYFRYDVTFGRDADTIFGRSAGRCMRRQMSDCARRIVAELERALRSR